MSLADFIKNAAVYGAATKRYVRQIRPVPKCAIFGDSRGANHMGALLYSVRGPFNWARSALNQRFDMDPAWVYAIAGTQIATDNGSGISERSQIAAVDLSAFGLAWLAADVNDITLGGPATNAAAATLADQMIAAKTVNLNTLLTAGVVPVIFTCIFPTIWSSTQRACARRYNTWVRGLRSDPRIVVIDAVQRVMDWTSATSQPIGSGANGYLYDTTHFGPLAAEIIGDDIAAALDPRLPAFTFQGMASPEDVYDATVAPSGSLVGATGAFLSGGGANTDIANNAGSASTGTVPAGCRLYKVNGQAIGVVGARQAGNISVNGANIPVTVEQISISSGGSGKQQVTLKFPDITTNFVAGDIVQMSAWINVLTCVGVYGASLQLWDMTTGGGSVNQNYGDLASFNNSGVYSFQQGRAKKGFQKSGRMTLTASTALLRPQIVIEVDGATVNAVIEVAVPAVRKV